MLRRLVVGLVALSVFSGCPGDLVDPDRFLTGRDGGGGGGCTIDVEQAIFAPKCGTAGCHDMTTAAQGLDLVSTGVKGRLRTQTATCTSAVGQKMGTFMLNKVSASPSCGGPMPLGGTTLTSAEVSCLNSYLQDAGAL
jgi:hypothetical protein